jgi:FMN phosphatase YigB (HAD superfamily)
VVKPNHEIFEIALNRLGVDAADTVMVGDSEEADGAARELGCGFVLVDPLPTWERRRTAARPARVRTGHLSRPTAGWVAGE